MSKLWIFRPAPETHTLRREITLAQPENAFALGGRSRGFLETACLAVFVGVARVRASQRFARRCETAWLRSLLVQGHGAQYEAVGLLGRRVHLPRESGAVGTARLCSLGLWGRWAMRGCEIARRVFSRA